jgi:histidyl-tRNA synthetase
MPEDVKAFAALKGTYDVLPPDSWRWQEVTRLALDTFARAGYAPVETPIFERTELFERGVGETSEVVGKQMYTFTDLGGRSLTLRPEGTAPVIRAVLEHGLHRGALPLKLAYAGPMFRQERPQKGRHRQFFQLGIEAIGSDRPVLDAEVIEVGARFLGAAGVKARLLVNSIGHVEPLCRLGYLKVLEEFLGARADDLAPSDRERLGSNPLRIFDSKSERTRAALEEAPLISDHLCAECRAHFDAVQDHLAELKVSFALEPRLVRGLDYYTRTAFEYVAENLGSQDAVGGGGRYDGLSEALGGPPLPGIGFALGLDRILLASRGDEDAAPPLDVFVVALGSTATRKALLLCTELRRRGLGADLDAGEASMKGQLRHAARSGARWAAIMGEAEISSGLVTIKDLASGEQRSVSFDELAERWTP